MPSSPSDSNTRLAVFISMGFLLLVVGIVLLVTTGWLGYVFMAAGVGLLLWNVLQGARGDDDRH